MLKRFGTLLLSHIAFIYVCIALLFYVYPIAGGDPTGWDLSSHYLLTEMMADNLRSGSISQFRHEWLVGFPSFTLYPPGFYLYALMPHYLSIAGIDELRSFQLAIALLPFGLLLSFVYCVRCHFGVHASRVAPLVMVLFFCYPSFNAHLGIGLSGTYSIGLLPQTMGLILLLLCLARLAKPTNWKNIFILGLTLCLLVLTHTMTAMLAATLILLHAFFDFRNWRAWRQVIGVASISCALSWFWLQPFLQHLPYSSSEAIGLGEFSDPLLTIFPGLSRGHWKYMLEASQYKIIFHNQIISLSRLLIDFPVSALLTLVLVGIGIWSLGYRREYFLISVYLLLLLLVPRNIGPEIFSLGIHYYRFIAPIFLITLLIAVAPFRVSTKPEAALGSRPRFILHVSLWFVALFLPLVQFRLFTDARDWEPNKHVYEAQLADYQMFRSGEEVFAALQALPNVQLLAVQSSPLLFQKLSSPHYFTAFVPKRLGIDVVPGLLVESSPTSNFINSTLLALDESLAIPSAHLAWGVRNVGAEYSFRMQTPDYYASKLAELGVSHFLATHPEFIRRLSQIDTNSAFRKVWGNTHFAIYALLDPASILEPLEYLPFAFYSDSSAGFKQFSEKYFAAHYSRTYTVAASTLPLVEQLEAIGSQFSGLLYQCQHGADLSDARRKLLETSVKRVILFGCSPASLRTWQGKSFQHLFGTLLQADLYLALSSLALQTTTSEADAGSSQAIFPKPFIHRRSFSPDLRVLQNDQQAVPVLRAVPNFSVFFGQGEFELKYQ
jgi:hypothetical protein